MNAVIAVALRAAPHSAFYTYGNRVSNNIIGKLYSYLNLA
jgi:hypothetical protein